MNIITYTKIQHENRHTIRLLQCIKMFHFYKIHIVLSYYYYNEKKTLKVNICVLKNNIDIPIIIIQKIFIYFITYQ